MKVDITTVGSFQRKLAFTVPADQVRSELETAFRALSQQVRMRGFRPGKTPRKVLEARYGAQVRSDVANNLIQRSYSNYLSDAEIKPVGRPSLDDAGSVDPAADFTFSVTVDVKPEITLDTYKGVKVSYPTVEVADSEVDRAVSARLEGQARLAEVTDRAVQSGDMALVELVATEGGNEVVREQGTMIRTAGDPYYTGVESLIIGLEVGGEASGSVSFADTARIPEVAGRTLDVTVKVQSVQATQVPELSDELAGELGYEGGADGMRAALRMQMQQARDEMARNQARANLLEQLIALNGFEVPNGMIDQSLDMLVEELKMQEAYRTGRDPRTISFNDATMADLRARARFAAKAGLILEYVSGHEKLDVTDDDVEAKLQQLADQRGQTIEAVKGYFAKEDELGELRDRILEEKTLDWLLEQSDLVYESAAAAPAKTEAAAEAPATGDAPAGEVDLSVLDGAVGAIKDAIASGAYDAHLDALEAAETAGKNRKGALEAIRARRG